MVAASTTTTTTTSCFEAWHSVQKNQRLTLALDGHRTENEALKSTIRNKDNQLSQQALQLDQQKKESDEHKEEITRLKRVISSKENQLIQRALENETMAKDLNHSRCTLSKLSERNDTLAAIAEELSINFAQQNIKYSALERDRCTAEEKACEVARVNIELQNSTNILQLAFEDNLQALDALRVDNSELKSKLQLMNASDPCNDRKERLMAKLHQRRELLALVKAARLSASERKAQAVAVEGPSEFTTAEQVSAMWDSFVQSNEAIVTVLRGGTWVEAIKLEKRGTSLNWVEYICDGVTECVPEEKILRKRKQRPRSYFESPPTPPNPNRRKRSKGIVTLPSRRL